MGVEMRAQLTAGEAKWKAVSEEDPVGSRLTKMEEMIADQNRRMDKHIAEMLETIRLNRFERVLDDPIAELEQLKETNGIVEYHKKFELLRTRVNLTEDHLVRVYLDGLQTDTQVNVQMFQPQTVEQCLLIGRLYEQAHRRSNIDNIEILPLKRDKELKAEEYKEVIEIEVESEVETKSMEKIKYEAILKEELITQSQEVESFCAQETITEVNRPKESLGEILEMGVQAKISSVGKVESDAYKVFDRMPISSHIVQSRKKKNLSPKSWMFKFKNMTLPRNRSQMDLHQVFDISKINNSYPCSSVNVGFVRKKRTFQRLRLKKQAHMSKILCKQRMLHDPGGMKNLLHGDMKPMFLCTVKSGEATDIAQEESQTGRFLSPSSDSQLMLQAVRVVFQGIFTVQPPCHRSLSEPVSWFNTLTTRDSWNNAYCATKSIHIEVGLWNKWKSKHA